MTEYKGYSLHVTKGNLKEIKAIGKGSVSIPLRGLYTSDKEAYKAIDAELSKKGKTNAKASSTNRSK